MAISVRASGTWSVSTTQSPTVTIPTYSAGDLGILVSTWRPYTVSATVNQSWNEIIDETPGSTANGNGVGSSRVYVAYKVLGASETNPTITRSGAITPAGAVIITLQKAAGDGDWTVTKIATAVEQAMGSTAMSHVLTTTAGILANDLVFALTAVADDSATFTRASTAISGGPSWGANVVEYPATHASSTSGNDMAADLIYRAASSYVASGQSITVTATLSAAERVASTLFSVRIGVGGSFDASAIVKKTISSSFTVDAVIKKTITSGGAGGTLTAYDGAAGLDIYASSTTGDYAVAREGTGAKSKQFTDADRTNVGQVRAGTTIRCIEGFAVFDTSSIGSSTVTSATLSTYFVTDNTAQDFTVQARLYDWGATLETADYVAGSALSGYTLLAHYALSGTFTGAYRDFTNDALASNINGSGYTRIIFNSDRHSSNTAPADGVYEYTNFYNGSAASNKARLVVEYSGAGVTLDAYIIKTVPGTFSANAVIKKTLDSTFTVDAVVKKTVSGSFAADAYIQLVQTYARVSQAPLEVLVQPTTQAVRLSQAPLEVLLTPTTRYVRLSQAVIEVLLPRSNGTFTLDAYISVGVTTQSGSFTADAVVRSIVSPSFTANAVLKRTQTPTGFLSNAVVKKTQAGSFSANAVASKTNTSSFSANATIKLTQTGSFSANAVVRRPDQAGSLTANAIVRRIQAGSFTADAAIRLTQAGSLTANAYLLAPRSASFIANADIKATPSGSFTANAVVRRTDQPGSFTAAATVRKTQAGAPTADAVLRAERSGSLTGNAYILIPRSGSFPASALIKASVGGTISANAVVQRLGQEGTFSAAATARGTAAGSFTANAVVLVVQAGNYSANAVVNRPALFSFASSAVIFGICSSSFAANAVIVQTQSSSFTSNGITRTTVSPSLTANAIVKRTNQLGSATADAIILRTYWFGNVEAGF